MQPELLHSLQFGLKLVQRKQLPFTIPYPLVQALQALAVQLVQLDPNSEVQLGTQVVPLNLYPF